MKIEVRKKTHGTSLVAIAAIAKGEALFSFEQHFLNHPTKTSMQIDEGKHQECRDPDAFENFLNHSCEPNGYIDFKDMTYRAKRLIKPGEQLNYNYLTTEWDLANKFRCSCGSPQCYGEIKGFKYLRTDQQKTLFPYASPFLKRKAGL